ncbi:MAG: CpaF family protein [Actinomycetota bacterium]
MTAPAYDEIRRRALELVETTRIDPQKDREAARAVVTDAVGEYQRRAHLGQGRALHNPSDMIDRVLRAVSELGPLTDLLQRRDIEEIFIEGGRVSYLDGTGRLRGLDQPTSEVENRHVVDRLLAETDRRLDVSSPIVQARVLNGAARLTGVIPPIGDQLSATIRRYALRRESLRSLVELGSLTVPAAGLLALAARTNASFLVSGPPGSGKTSMLAALIQAVPSAHCIRCCEEVRELHVPLVHGSYYEARPPSLEGKGEISLRDLVKVVLAMRPDRIVVGEVRGAEAFELTRAVNAGCGFGCTIHANSARQALNALVNAALMAGENVAETVVRKVFSATLDLVVHLDRDATGVSEGPIRRQVMEVLALVPALHDDFSTQPLFVRKHLGAPLEWTGALLPDSLADRVERVLPGGTTLGAVLEGRVAVV